MQTIPCRQTTAALAQGLLSLPGRNEAVLSQYFQTADLRKDAPGRNINISAIMKALVNGFGYSNGSLAYGAAVVFDDGTTIISTRVDSTDILHINGMSQADIRTAFNADVVADAAIRSITLTSSDIGWLPDVPSVTAQKAYEGTTSRSNPIPVSKSATVASGVAVFQLTVDGLSTGASLFPNGVIKDSVSLTVSDATASYQMSYAFSNSDKTLTVTANKLTTANILTGLLGQAAANAAVVKLSVIGY